MTVPTTVPTTVPRTASQKRNTNSSRGHMLSTLYVEPCLSQVANVAHRAVAAYSQSQEREERRQRQVEADAFTFKVPVTLAGLQLDAEFRVRAPLHTLYTAGAGYGRSKGTRD